MANDLIIQGNGKIFGDLTITGAINGISRSDLDTETLRVFEQDILQAREVATADYHNHLQNDAGAGDGDLRIVGGTYGTDTPSIQSGDVMAVGLKTRSARILVKVPTNYVDASPLTLRLRSGMKTTVADTSATADCECYLSNKEAGKHATQTGDMCTTSAISINSLTLSNRDFTLTPTYVVAGDLLDIKLTLAITDASSGTAVIGVIGNIALLCSTKG